MIKIDLLELEPVGSHETDPFAAQDGVETSMIKVELTDQLAAHQDKKDISLLMACIWTRDPNDFEYEGYVWASGCNRVFEFMDNRSPGQVGFRTCPFCGAYLVGRIYADQEDDDGDN